MQLTVDTSQLDTDTLGRLLMIFLKSSGVDIEAGTYILGMGWNISDEAFFGLTDPRLLQVLMGDEANEPRAVERVFDLQYKDELTVLRYFDGDIGILFHKKGDNGFTIINKGSSLNRWERVTLEVSDGGIPSQTPR